MNGLVTCHHEHKRLDCLAAAAIAAGAAGFAGLTWWDGRKASNAAAESAGEASDRWMLLRLLSLRADALPMRLS
jgi:hypothetical protein